MAILGYWRFNGNSNDALGSYSGTDSNMTYANGVAAQSAVFNGSTGRIQAGSGLHLTGNYTISGCMFMANPPDTSGMALINKREYLYDGYEISVYGTGGVYTILIAHVKRTGSGTNYYIDAVITTLIAKWVYFTAVYNGSKILLYVNGVEKNNKNCAENLGTSTKLLNFGNFGLYNGSELNRYWNGSLDETKISNDAWSAAKIKNEYSRVKGFF